MPKKAIPANERLLVRAPDAIEMLSIGKTKFYEQVRAGTIPKPIKWDGCSVWRVEDLKECVDKLAG